jgi:hypothetical protein
LSFSGLLSREYWQFLADFSVAGQLTDSIFRGKEFWVFYEASSGNSLPTFRDNQFAPSSGLENLKIYGLLAPVDGTDRLTRNVGKELPLLGA